MTAYRASRHESTGYSPNFLTIRREVRGPVDIVYGVAEEKPIKETYDSFVEMIRRRMTDAYSEVRKALKSNAERNKRYYACKVRPQTYPVEPTKVSRKQIKWMCQFSGPFLVIRTPSPVTVEIQSSRKAKPFVVHIDKVKPYLAATPNSWLAEPNLMDSYVLSKLLQRLVAKQLVTYLKDNNLLPDRQSAYRAHHSTAVLRVLADILLALNSGNLAVLTLLDLSAAFDSVDHGILLRRLQTTYGLGGVVMDWYRSYLNGRTQYVRSSTTSSSPSAVPQGSVLGPILFLLYTADLLQLVIRHHLHPHAYADDTQIYGSCIPPTLTCYRNACPSALMRCRSNRLLLNPTKTGAVVLICSA